MKNIYFLLTFFTCLSNIYSATILGLNLGGTDPGAVFSIDTVTLETTRLINLSGANNKPNNSGLASLNGELYGSQVSTSDGFDPAVLKIDLATGGTDNIIVSSGFFGLASDPLNNVLIGYNSGFLISIDPTNGNQQVLVSSLPELFAGLATGNGVVYGIDSNTDTLFEIDPVSGTRTAIGSSGQLGFDFGGSAGLAYDPLSDILYATDSRDFYSIDPNTGVANNLGRLDVTIESLAFHSGAVIIPETSTYIIFVMFAILLVISRREKIINKV